MVGQRWVVLGAGLVAVAAGCAVQYGAPFLIPALVAGGLSLPAAGTLSSAPIVGLLLTLYAWGAAADRWGERRVMTLGLTLGGLALLAWAVPASGAFATGGPAPDPHGMAAHPVGLGVSLLLAGAGTAAVHAASGRLVLGWFAGHERGRAMAVRQTAQPLGVAVAGLAVPPLAESGVPLALVLLGSFALAAAGLAAALVRDPTRPPIPDPTPPDPTPTAAGDPTGPTAAGDLTCPTQGDPTGPTAAEPPTAPRAKQDASPYRTAMLWRIHGASSLLVVPQFLTSAYALVYLVDAQGWASVPAGRLLAGALVGGALTRLLVGWWSDRAGSRLGPMRRLAAGIAVALVALGLATLSGSPGLAVTALLVATVLSSSTNGLAFTAVAERAGGAWAGRALGVQNTAQNLVAAATPAAFGLVIGAIGYAGAFAGAGVFPVAACLLVPVRGERPTPGECPTPGDCPVRAERQAPGFRPAGPVR